MTRFSSDMLRRLGILLLACLFCGLFVVEYGRTPVDTIVAYQAFLPS